MGGIPGVAQKPGFGVEGFVVDKAELMGDVTEVLCAGSAVRDIAHGVFGIERLGHVKAVQPHLIGVYGLVPETSFRGAGLALKLAVEGIHCHAVLFLSGNVV